MIILLAALLQAAAADGGVRITRESDPATVCMVMSVIESRKTPTPITSLDRKPGVNAPMTSPPSSGSRPAPAASGRRSPAR